MSAAVARTYGKLRFVDGAWWVGQLEPHVAIRFKANFPKVPKGSNGPFRLDGEPVTAADLAWFVSRYPLDATPEDAARLVEGRAGFEAIQAEAGRILAPDYQPPAFAGLKPGQVVRIHQARAAEMVARFGGLLVGDDVGEGKTYTGGACCLLPGALPAAVVCPPHLRIQWSDKLREFTTLKVHVVKGTKPYSLPPADVYIWSYSNLAGWVDFLPVLGIRLAIFDEAHSLRHGEGEGNQSIAKGAAAMRLAETCTMRLATTATPIFNYGDEIWNVMQFIRPDVLGDYWDFKREWCSGREVRDPEALGSFLREQHAMIRKRGSAPAPNVLVVEVDHDVQRLKSVEELATHLAWKVRHGAFEESGQAARQLDLMLRMETGIAKAPAVAKFVRLIAAERPVILFGWHRAVYDIWLRDLADFHPVLYTGSETPRRKEDAKKAFLAGLSRVFIMSLRSGEGVDGLQAVCSDAVIGELDWSPATHTQNFGRINREGQPCWPSPVNGYILVANDGSDPAMQDMLGLKASQAQGIVDPGLGPQRVVRDITPFEALVERYIGRLAA